MQAVKIEEKAADSNLRFEKAVVKIFDKGHKKQLGLLKSLQDKGHKKRRTQKAYFIKIRIKIRIFFFKRSLPCIL